MGKFDLDHEYFIGDRDTVEAMFMDICRDFMNDDSIPTEAKGVVIQKLIGLGPDRAKSKLRPIGEAVSSAVEAARRVTAEALDRHKGVGRGAAQPDSIRRYTELTRDRIARAVLSHLPDYPVVANMITRDELATCEAEILALFDPVETGALDAATDSVGPPLSTAKSRYGDITPAKRPECEEFLKATYASEIKTGTLTRAMVRKHDGPLFTALYSKYRHDPAKLDEVLPRHYARRQARTS